MKKYLVSRELKPYIRNILDRRMMEYHFSSENGKYFCNISVPNEVFHRLVKRAACEKASSEAGVTYVTREECSSPMYLSRLKKELGVNEVFVYKKG